MIHSVAIKNSRKGPLSIGTASKLHPGSESEWLQNNGITEILVANSSLKLCWLAEGKVDIYPRFRPTMEWDTGAGEIILQESDCEIVQFEDLSPMPHNQENLTNPAFLAIRKNAREIAESFR